VLVEKFIVYDYLKENQVLSYSDMLKIKESDNISISDQMKALKILQSENKVLNRSASTTEPFFEIVEKKGETYDFLHSEEMQKNRNIREKVFKYLHEKKGYYNELEFFMEHGISFEYQMKILNKLMDEGAIEKISNGYTIKRK